MIGDSILTVDDTSDISINGRHFKGNRGLWEILNRKNVTRGVVTADDLKRYKTILQLTNAHLQRYKPGGNVQTSRGPKFREVISKLFPQTRRPRGVELSLSRQWERYLLSVIDVFSKYLHVVTLKPKTGPSVTAAFQSVLKDRR